MKTVYLQLDEDNFCIGWGSNEEENSTKIEIEDLIVLDKIRMYRYENGELVYDETKSLLQAKNSYKTLAEKKNNDKILKGFQITIDNIEYVYPYDEENKAYLNKVYELCTSGLIDHANLNLLKDEEIIILKVNKVNITELWLLSFLHEEGSKEALAETKNKINNCKNLSELQQIILE